MFSKEQGERIDHFPCSFHSRLMVAYNIFESATPFTATRWVAEIKLPIELASSERCRSGNTHCPEHRSSGGESSPIDSSISAPIVTPVWKLEQREPKSPLQKAHKNSPSQIGLLSGIYPISRTHGTRIGMWPWKIAAVVMVDRGHQGLRLFFRWFLSRRRFLRVLNAYSSNDE